MKTIAAYTDANPELFRQEELILEAMELIAGVMVQVDIKAPELSAKLNKPCTFIASHLSGEEELSLRAVADIFGAMGFRVRMSAIHASAHTISLRPSFVSQDYRKHLAERGLEVAGFPSEIQDKVQPTWAPVYVERAICDLIPDVGYAREIARDAWKWDDEHPTAPIDIYRWQNEAIRQRRDLLALQAQVENV